MLNHKTLTDGEMTTMFGQIVSVGSNVLVIGGTTYSLSQSINLIDSAATSDESLEAIIVFMFEYASSSMLVDTVSISGAHGMASSTALGGLTLGFKSTVVPFIGAQSRYTINKGLLSIIALLCIGLSVCDLLR